MAHDRDRWRAPFESSGSIKRGEFLDSRTLLLLIGVSAIFSIENVVLY